MMIPILNVVELLEKHSQAAEKVCGFQFVHACLTAARYLVEQGERIVDLEQELTMTKLERDYNRSRAAFFGEVAGVTDKVISVEGFKAFRGTMKIRPKTAAVPAFELSGDWLYKPETGCWYGKGSSFPEDICTIVEVGTKKLIEWKSDLICGGFAEEWAYVCPECGCKISDRSGVNLGEYGRNNQRLNYCPNCGSITKKEVKA